jgi:ribosomal protein L35
MKTHRGLAKRVKVTGTGRVLMMGHHRNNKKMKKRAEKLHALHGMQPVHATHTKRLKRLLPNHRIA